MKLFTCALAVSCLFTSARAAPTDLWDATNGTAVTATSGVASVYVSPSQGIANMFTPKANPSASQFDDQFNTLFADNVPAGFTHWVEWQTPTPVTLTSFALYAQEDYPLFNTFVRSFDNFNLYAWDGTTFQSIFSTATAHPYSFVDPSQDLLYSVNVSPVTTDRFRAEFVQDAATENAYLGNTTYGPRILELAGYGVAVPEPSYLVVAAIAAAVVAMMRRRQVLL
jgi:hypothetical protein